MSTELKEIKAGVGLGVLKFGMDRNQVQMILGAPEEKDTFFYKEEGNSEAESWYYDSIDLSLEFDAEEDWKLVTIEINSEAYTFHGSALVGQSKEALKAELKKHNIEDWEHEELFMEEAPTRELISSGQLGINFWFEENAITEIQWGPLFVDEETIKWPVTI